MAMQNISATINEDLLRRLNEVADVSERKRSWLIAKAVELYLEELEDLQIAKSRIGEARLTPAKLRKTLRA